MENQNQAKKYSEWLIGIGLLIVFLAPRLIGLAKFATLDEPYWLVSGSNFYYALGQRDFASTVWDYHPAVTTMWLITLVLLFYFPAYRGQGQGYFYVYKEWKWEAFLREFGKQAIDVLFYSRLLQVLLLAALFILLYWLMQKVIGKRLTIAGLLFLSFDPMFLGHSRLLTHEAMLVSFLLVSFAAMAVYLFAEGKFGFVLLSAIAGSLAQLTKSSGIVLFPLILLMIAIKIWDERKSVPLLKSFSKRLKMLVVWAAALALVYFAAWPGMWVKPASILHEVYGNALSYAFKGARLYTTQNLDNINFNINPGRINFYTETMVWRTTPLMWLGTLAALAVFFKRDFFSKNGKFFSALTALFGIGMFMMFSLLKGRDSAHYVMLTYAALAVIAGIGLLGLMDWLARNKTNIGNLFFGIALAVQAAFVLPFHPYYYTYYNPVMEAAQPGVQNGNFGYGEGLDLAAQYLNTKHDAKSLTVLAYWGDGPFSYFFNGRTIMLVNNYYKPELKGELLADLRRSDYLVVYYQFQKSLARVMNVVNALEPHPPEHIIWMNGIEAIRIYNIHELPQEFFDTIANQ